MIIYVTGANGLLGKDLCHVLKNQGHKIIKNNTDILDFDNLNLKITNLKPDLIIHLAGYTDVEKAEAEFDKADSINSKGTKNLALIAKTLNATLIYISTDYVFDGTKKTPYLPYDKPNPINNYGLTKLNGERAIKSILKKYYIVRTSSLYGFYGKNFVDTILNKKDNEYIEVIDDETVCPTSSLELSKNLLKILNKPYGIYHICSNNCATRYEIAKKIYEIENIKTKIKPVKSYPSKAKRPKYSALKSSIKLNDWDKSIKEYLNLKHTLFSKENSSKDCSE